MFAFRKQLENYAKIHRNLLAMVGCLPSKSGEFKILHMVFVFLLSVYAIISTFQCIWTAWPDQIDEIAYNVTPFLAQILIASKQLNFIIKRKDNSKLLKIIEEKFWSLKTDRPSHEKAILIKYERYVYIFNVAELIPMFTAGPLWLFSPIVQMFLSKKNSDGSLKRILPFNNNHFNLDIYVDPLYEFLYILQSLSFVLGVISLTAMDCLYVFFIMNTCAQFKILQMRIKNFHRKENEIKYNMKEQEKNVHECVKHHQQLLEFCQDLEGTITYSLLIQVFVGVTFLCTAGFIMTMFPGNGFIWAQNILCMCASISELFLHCYTGNLLTTEGMNVAFAAYNSYWYNTPCSIQKLILIIINRAQRPVYVTVGKFTPVSVSLFESIVRTAVSYFTVLTSMREE